MSSKRRSAAAAVAKPEEEEAQPAAKRAKPEEAAEEAVAPLAKWEDAFVLDLGKDWQKAYELDVDVKREAQVNWIRQLIGLYLVPPEEKAFSKINKDLKISERFGAFTALLDEHRKVFDCLTQSIVTRKNDGPTVNPFALLTPIAPPPPPPAPAPAKHTPYSGRLASKVEAAVFPGSGPAAVAFVHVTAGLTLSVMANIPFVIGRSYSPVIDGQREPPERQTLSLNLKNLPGSDKVSRLHAVIRCVDSRWQLENISPLGTFVDDVLVPKDASAPLRHGSHIWVGSQSVAFFTNPNSRRD